MDIDSMSDDELRRQLSSKGLVNVAITDQTRQIFRNKLKKLSGQSIETTIELKKITDLSSPALTTIPDSPSTRTPDSAKGFYVVFGLSRDKPFREVMTAVYDCYSDAQKAAKEHKAFGGRISKRFDSRNDAEIFKRAKIEEEPVHIHCKLTPAEMAQIKERQFNPLSSVKTKPKNRLRKLVENDDPSKGDITKREISEFINLIWSNPKHLVSSGDCPEIYHEGMRRNILHCAVDYGNLEFCKILLETIEDDKFWKKLYPMDPIEKREFDKLLLLDRYLNMQDGTVQIDRGGGTAIRTNERGDDDIMKVKTLETPLHIASKKGYEHIVRLLMSHPVTDATIRNYNGLTAADIACTRTTRSCDDSLKKRIIDIINDPPIYYVPEIISPERSYLGDVCILRHSPSTNPCLIEYEDTNTGSQIIGRSFAGPLSPVQAAEFRKQWKSPLIKEERKEAINIRRSDPDRGQARIGRSLAHSQGVRWAEYWEFLSCYCDLSDNEGLQKLEVYLSGNECRHTDSLGRRDDSEVPCKLLYEDKLAAVMEKEDPLAGLIGMMSLGSKTDWRLVQDVLDVCTQRLKPERTANKRNTEGTNIEGTNTEGTNTEGTSTCTATTAKSDIDKKNREVILHEDFIELPIDQNSTKTTGRNNNNPKTPEHHIVNTDPDNILPKTKALDDTPDTDIVQMSSIDEFFTPLKTPQTRTTFIAGDAPTKLDQDVYLALCNATIDPVKYPFITNWKTTIESHNEEDRKLWPTPKSSQYSPPSHRHDTPLSPLLLSSSPMSHMTRPHYSNLRTPRQQATPTRPSKLLSYSPFK